MRAPRPPIPLLLVFAVVVIGTVGCGSTPPSLASGAEVAIVNGERLSNAAFERFVTVKLGEFAAEPLDDTVRSELLDEFVKREITAQAAARLGLRDPAPGESPNDADGRVHERSTDALVERYYREVVLREVEVTPEEITDYFDAHRDSYSSAGGLYVREIRVKTREEAETARRAVTSGCAFADVARDVSTSPTSAQGGLAYYEAKALPPTFARAIEPLTTGQMSGVVRSDLGYHVFLLERRGSVPSLERVRDRVADDVRASKNERLVEADLERLLGESNVTINRTHLPFQYEGRFGQ